MNDRIIALVDMDCFYCQVETRLCPSLQGKPVAVVQYNAWKGGGIIAVNYEARARGVTRFMRGEEAKKHCPEIELVSVPTLREKADLTKYRDASREVVAVFCTFSDCVERASIDEAFIDLTKVVEKRLKTLSIVTADHLPNSFVIGYSPQKSNEEADRSSGVKAWLEEVYNSGLCDTAAMKLAVASVIVEEMRAAVFKETSFRCSAGIAHNKILAKLACGMHKPNRQTILPHPSVEELYKILPVKKVRSLGGKFGDDIVDSLGCKMMYDLTKYTEKELQNRYDEKTGTWLYNIARGIDYEPVISRLVSKSIGCCKNFPGRNALSTKHDIDYWLKKLVEELVERLMEDQSINKRKAQLLTVSVHLGLKKNDISSSRSTSLPSYEVERIIQTAYSLLKKMANVNNDNWTTPLSFLGLSAGKFTEIKTTSSISQFFKSSAVSSEKDDNSAVLLKQMGWQEIKQKPENETEDGSSFFQKFLSNNQNLERINTSLNLIPKLPQETYQDNDDSQSSMGGMSYNHNNCEGLLNEASSDAKGQNEKLNPNNVECSLICQESVSKTSTKTSIKDFFSKTESEKFNCPGNNSKPSKENGGPISKYFKNPSSVWIDPSEIFPDLNSVDEELISSLPTMFRKQILKMKELQGNSSVQEKTPVVAIQNNNIDCQSCDNEAQKGNESQPTVLKENLNINSDNNENSSVQSEDGKKCSQCNVVFPIFLFDEHMDFHLAETLHRELNYSSQIERPMIVDKKIPQATLPKRKGKASERKLLNEKKT